MPGDIPATFQKALQVPLDRMKQFTVLIEKVARLFPAVSVTSMIPVNHDTCQSNHHRSTVNHITSHRVDQTEVFKILNGYENIDRNIFFTVKEERRTRGHGVTLAKKQCRLDIRTFLFSQRIVNEWNILSADCRC